MPSDEQIVLQTDDFYDLIRKQALVRAFPGFAARSTATGSRRVSLEVDAAKILSLFSDHETVLSRWHPGREDHTLRHREHFLILNFDVGNIEWTVHSALFDARDVSKDIEKRLEPFRVVPRIEKPSTSPARPHPAAPAAPTEPDPILMEALHSAPELAAGWDSVTLTLDRSEDFRAFGCAWSASIEVTADGDGGPEAHVFLDHEGIPADAGGARAFVEEVRRRLDGAGYSTDTACARRSLPGAALRAERGFKSSTELLKEAHRLSKLRLAPG